MIDKIPFGYTFLGMEIYIIKRDKGNDPKKLLSTNSHFHNFSMLCNMLINIFFLFTITHDVSDMFLNIMLCDARIILLCFYMLCSLNFIIILLLLLSTLFLISNILLLLLLLLNTIFLIFNILLLLFKVFFLLTKPFFSSYNQLRKKMGLLPQTPSFLLWGIF